ncbi:hypothetical protein VE01_05027 [Pseudogymnoascus verrucosus]|uniref:FAD-binding domain-containing protein n=1 Tax=Pseudogymnoascus verrucosus TaxID=342668 RepID=A0A1B8GPH6_9PEZI|nr:uncharacterized protein VE01_05027 [Pseudogymnoascus verrucosus]OBT97710.1 hypothetical protein VE01_05027 [Pseudogymnoascus verrucosus]
MGSSMNVLDDELNIVVIGAGLGGLAVALALRTATSRHVITVLESAPALAEIGAGLQITPNAAKLLIRWGLGDQLQKVTTVPEQFTIYRYSNGEVLGKRDNYGAEMLAKYGAPFWDVHRADLQIAMYERAKNLGIKFRFSAQVESYDLATPKAILQGGEEVHADLIIAADGLWSRCRSSMLGYIASPTPTGDLAYRIVLNFDQVKDPEVLRFLSKPQVHLWAGPDCHAIYYPLRNNTMCNIVLLVPDNLPENVARAPGSIDEMKEIFRNWDPILQKLLSLVTDVDKWKLMHREEMDAWSNEHATVAFLGDSCHPMLPYMAQGANSSIEDGAALGVLLSKLSKKEDLASILQVYQDLRKPRSTAIAKSSEKQRYYNHLPDGAEQKVRDALMKSQIQEPQPGYPFYWIDPQMQSWVYGYDADLEAHTAWDKFLKDSKQKTLPGAQL